MAGKPPEPPAIQGFRRSGAVASGVVPEVKGLVADGLFRAEAGGSGPPQVIAAH